MIIMIIKMIEKYKICLFINRWVNEPSILYFIHIGEYMNFAHKTWLIVTEAKKKQRKVYVFTVFKLGDH